MEAFLIVHGEPRSKQRPRFVKGHAYTPAETREAEQKIKKAYIVNHGKKMLVGTLQVDLEFYLGTKRRKDLDNMEKLVLDALNGVAYEDDYQIFVKRSSKIIDKSIEPQTRILIREINDEENIYR